MIKVKNLIKFLEKVPGDTEIDIIGPDSGGYNCSFQGVDESTIAILDNGSGSSYLGSTDSSYLDDNDDKILYQNES